MKNWLLVFFWAGLIFLGSCLPGVGVSQSGLVDFSAHKLVHIFEYGILAILLLRAFNFRVHKSIREYEGKKAFALVFLVLALCFLYGLSDEYHQSFTFGREAKLHDAFIDLLGGFLGILVLWKLPPKVQKKLLS